MSGRILNSLLIVVFGGVIVTQGQVAQAVCECDCNADVDGNGVVNIDDLVILVQCFQGDCSGCVNSCDLNCDGTLGDDGDVDALFCILQLGIPEECCPGFPICGDGTCDPECEDCNTCLEDCPPTCGDDTCECVEGCSDCPEDCGVCNPDAVPSVSSWGIASLVLLVMVTGTVVLRRKAVAATTGSQDQ